MTFPFPLPSRYELCAERLEGGQGFVYICIDHFLQRKVAIKVVKHLSDINALKKEMRTLSEVRSRHVAELYDLITAKRSGMCGLVEEYVGGPSLDEYIKTADAGDYLRILWQLASGLSDIHVHGKIHRDIKPGNVRFDAEGVLKILDFGLAMDRKDAETIYSRGTKYFLAPELYRTPPIKVKPAVDVYAFGVLAWYIGTGGKLHPAIRESPPASKTSMPSFADIKSSLPADLISLLDRTIDVDPAVRPQMLDLRLALERHILYGKHRAHIAYGGDSRILSTVGESATLRSGQDVITIIYNGLTFAIASVQGNVYVNNVRAVVGQPLPGSCVVTLGYGTGWSRVFVPIDMSHPGVVI